MKKLSQKLLLVALLTTSALALAVPARFDDPATQARYEQLLGELRCLVCQNESLASSGAGLADDLRGEVHRMVGKGMSNAQIKDYLVERYGDFVLYRPRVNARTWLLWFGPAILVIGGLITLLVIARRRSAVAGPTQLDASEREQRDRVLRQYQENQADQQATRREDKP